MITYELEYSNDKEVKYNYFPFDDSQDKGYVIISRQGELLARKLTKADEIYPFFFEHMLCIACENAVRAEPKLSGAECWM